MSVLRSAFLISVLSVVGYCESDCRISYKFSNRSGDSALFGQQPVISPPNTSPQYDNRLSGCTGWALNYDNEGFSALSIQLEDAPTSSTSGTAGSFVAFAGSTVSGSNPATNTTSGSFTGTGYYPYLRVNVSSVTGTGSINVTLNGWKSPNYIATLGGGGGGSGTVTSVATTGPITGGTFTTSGTIACATCLVSDGNYTNPSWFVSIPSTKVTGLPTFPSGTIVGTTDTQTLTNKTVDGVAPATLAFMDATSSVQTQLNTKGTGTVTSVATSSPLGGGTITGTGTLTCTTCGVTGTDLGQFASTSSSTLATVISDETGSASAVFANTPTLITPNITTSSTLSNNGISAVSTDGLIIQNTTAATVGAQQFSPRIKFISQGWKTTSTAASQTVSWTIENKPVQAATSPDSLLNFTPVVNGTTKSGFSLCSNSTNAGVTVLLDNSLVCNNSTGYAGLTSFASNTFNWITNAADRGSFNNNGILMTNTSGLMFASGAAGSNTTGDISLDRDAAGILGVYSGVAPGTTAANYRFIKHAGTLVGGTTFTATGLSVGTLVGGATAGTFTLGAGGPGSVVVTMGNSATAPTGWACSASDRSTLTALVDQSASTTTTASINIPVASLNGDVISFYCVGY